MQNDWGKKWKKLQQISWKWGKFKKETGGLRLDDLGSLLVYFRNQHEFTCSWKMARVAQKTYDTTWKTTKTIFFQLCRSHNPNLIYW